MHSNHMTTLYNFFRLPVVLLDYFLKGRITTLLIYIGIWLVKYWISYMFVYGQALSYLGFCLYFSGRCFGLLTLPQGCPQLLSVLSCDDSLHWVSSFFVTLDRRLLTASILLLSGRCFSKISWCFAHSTKHWLVSDHSTIHVLEFHWPSSCLIDLRIQNSLHVQFIILLEMKALCIYHLCHSSCAYIIFFSRKDIKKWFYLPPIHLFKILYWVVYFICIYATIAILSWTPPL